MGLGWFWSLRPLLFRIPFIKPDPRQIFLVQAHSIQDEFFLAFCRGWIRKTEKDNWNQLGVCEACSIYLASLKQPTTLGKDDIDGPDVRLVSTKPISMRYCNLVVTLENIVEVVKPFSSSWESIVDQFTVPKTKRLVNWPEEIPKLKVDGRGKSWLSLDVESWQWCSESRAHCPGGTADHMLVSSMDLEAWRQVSSTHICVYRFHSRRLQKVKAHAGQISDLDSKTAQRSF